MERVFLRKSLTSRQRSKMLRLVANVCVPLTLAHASLPAYAQDDGTGGAARSGDPVGVDEPSTAPPPRAALEHYEKGRALYLAGRYRDAVGELESALALDPDSPNLVYNLAHVYELLGEIDLAIRHYKHYRDLLTDADAAEIARVDGTLQRLQGARQEVVDSPPPPPPIAPPERGVADAAFWSFTTLALGGLVAGGVLGVMALKAEKDAQRFVIQEPGDADERQRLIDRTNTLALASDISLIGGAVLGTTAVLLFALRTKPAKSSPGANPNGPASWGTHARPTALGSWGIGAGPKGAFLSFRRPL